MKLQKVQGQIWNISASLPRPQFVVKGVIAFTISQQDPKAPDEKYSYKKITFRTVGGLLPNC